MIVKGPRFGLKVRFLEVLRHWGLGWSWSPSRRGRASFAIGVCAFRGRNSSVIHNVEREDRQRRDGKAMCLESRDSRSMTRVVLSRVENLRRWRLQISMHVTSDLPGVRDSAVITRCFIDGMGKMIASVQF